MQKTNTKPGALVKRICLYTAPRKLVVHAGIALGPTSLDKAFHAGVKI